MIELFKKHNVSLVSLSESLDATKAAGELMMNLLTSVSQWGRKVIGERTKDAIQYLKKQGKAYSRPAYRYNIKTGQRHESARSRGT